MDRKLYVLTGATKGIGAALAARLAAPGRALVIVGRDAEAGETVAANARAQGGDARFCYGDLAHREGARTLARSLAELGEIEALIHNAGHWPHKRVCEDGELERAFVVNHLSPYILTERLLPQISGRIVFVSAGLIVKGRWDEAQTPYGHDFHPIKTYCNTKLASALYIRRLASRTSGRLSVLAGHPGVVRTELGARPGLIGMMLNGVKRFWMTPHAGAKAPEHLALAPELSEQTDIYFHEMKSVPWPGPAQDSTAQASVEACSAALAGEYLER